MTSALTPAWLDLPAVAESRLDDALRSRLATGEGGPPSPPPWTTSVSAVLWWHRAAPGAADHLPEALRSLPRLPVTVAALVRYRDSPVGSYSEVFASPVLLRQPTGRRFARPAITVPFIAVDSLASVVGGRAGWLLPKTLARALWPPDGAARIETDDWSVAVSVDPQGPRLPLRGRLPLLQPDPDGGRQLSMVRMLGRAQLARANVITSGPTLPSWLRSGRHPCVAISDGQLRISAPDELAG